MPCLEKERKYEHGNPTHDIFHGTHGNQPNAPLSDINLNFGGIRYKMTIISGGPKRELTEL